MQKYTFEKIENQRFAKDADFWFFGLKICVESGRRIGYNSRGSLVIPAISNCKLEIIEG